MDISAYRRQFLIARQKFSPGSDWLHRDLPDGWVLSWQKDLDLAPGEDTPGNLTLGQVYGCGGRHAILNWPHLCQDVAGALLPVFYGRTPEGKAVAGSNARLVAEAIGQDPERPAHADPLRHHGRLNYIPLPGTRYAGVKRLIRDQKLNLLTGEVEHHPSQVEPFGSYEEAFEVLKSEIVANAKAIAGQTRGRIFMQLTAGLDSRTVTSAFHAADVEFETVTIRSSAKPEDDITVARDISRKLGVRHHVVDLQTPPDPAIREIYRRQTSDGIFGWDMTDLFPGRAFRFLGKDDVMVGGGGFELGRPRASQVHIFGDATPETITGAQIWQAVALEPGPAVFTGFLDEWLDWRRRHPDGLSLQAGFYLDQRISGWLGLSLSVYDLLPGRTVHISNNPRILSALVTPEHADRVAGRMQHEAVAALAPELAGLAVNPVSLSRRVQKLAAGPKRALRQQLQKAGLRQRKAHQIETISD